MDAKERQKYKLAALAYQPILPLNTKSVSTKNFYLPTFISGILKFRY